MLQLHLENSKNRKFNILCIGAHSDDIEIGCGGTVLKLIKNYNVNFIKWIIFCSDRQREFEARESADIFLKNVKNKDILIKNYRDGFLPYIGSEVKEFFEEMKKDFTPDIIFTHYRKDYHQDHRLICELTWNTFRDHLILEYEIPKFDGDMGIPNFFVYLDDDIVDKKINTILNCFKTQSEKQWFERETFLSIMRIRGMESASKSRYAEAFYSPKIVLS
jgi:LmbE family N-acetylglucosaminyl deacetylase